MFSTRKSSLGLHCSQLVLCAALGFGWSQSAYAKATITTFDLPNSDGTVPIAIQNGVITGYYYFGPAHGFIRFPDGTTTTFDPAGSANTYANSISGSGAVTGYFVDDQLAEHGFVRTPDGNITTFDVPGGVSTEAWWINKKGTIAGQSYNGAGDLYCGYRYHCHGFFRTSRGKIRTFDAPGSIQTWPWQINDHGMIVGSYVDGAQAQHGFVRAKDGTITAIDPPGSTQTYASTINNKGEIAGNYNDATGEHVFVRTPDGAFTTFDLPECSYFGINQLNDKGRITGFCVDGNNVYHALLGRSDGSFKTFDVQGSQGTFAWSIDDAGETTGWSSLDGTTHGFLRSR